MIHAKFLAVLKTDYSLRILLKKIRTSAHFIRLYIKGQFVGCTDQILGNRQADLHQS